MDRRVATNTTAFTLRRCCSMPTLGNDEGQSCLSSVEGKSDELRCMTPHQVSALTRNPQLVHRKDPRTEFIDIIAECVGGFTTLAAIAKKPDRRVLGRRGGHPSTKLLQRFRHIVRITCPLEPSLVQYLVYCTRGKATVLRVKKDSLVAAKDLLGSPLFTLPRRTDISKVLLVSFFRIL